MAVAEAGSCYISKREKTTWNKPKANSREKKVTTHSAKLKAKYNIILIGGVKAGSLGYAENWENYLARKKSNLNHNKEEITSLFNSSVLKSMKSDVSTEWGGAWAWGGIFVNEIIASNIAHLFQNSSGGTVKRREASAKSLSCMYVKPRINVAKSRKRHAAAKSIYQ